MLHLRQYQLYLVTVTQELVQCSPCLQWTSMLQQPPLIEHRRKICSLPVPDEKRDLDQDWEL